MSKQFSRFISFIFHPLVMPLYLAFIVVAAHPMHFGQAELMDGKERIPIDVLLLVFGALVVFLPLFSLFLMKKLGLYSSEIKTDPKQRFIPMIAIFTFWSWAYFMFKEGGLYPTSSYFPLGNLLLGNLIALAILFVLNFISNVNWHMISIGIAISLIINLFNTSHLNLLPIFIPIIIVGGLVGTAQLSFDINNKESLLGGFLLGFFSQFIAFQIGQGLPF